MSKSTSQIHIESGAKPVSWRRYATLAAGIGLSWLLLPAPAVAQDADAKPTERPARERLRPAAGGGGIFRVLDLNADGQLDRSEIDLAVVSLRKLDRNGDGKLTPEELGNPQRGRGAGPAAKSRPQLDFSKLDNDGDGKISKEEFPQAMQARFERMDRSGDGFIDAEEQELVMRFIRQRGQGDAGAGNRGQRRARGGGAGQGGSEKPKRPPVDGDEG